jgi:hypothetical protein
MKTPHGSDSCKCPGAGYVQSWIGALRRAMEPAQRPIGDRTMMYFGDHMSGWALMVMGFGAVLFWAALVLWLAYLLSESSDKGRETDEANLREWIDEGRSFRKTLPEVVREYLKKLDDFGLLDAGADEIHVGDVNGIERWRNGGVILSRRYLRSVISTMSASV